MAESSRKKSRKSKLEPREYIDLDDYEEIITTVQEPEAPGPSLLPKIKTDMTENNIEEEEALSIEFDINVEVEECQEEDTENQYIDANLELRLSGNDALLQRTIDEVELKQEIEQLMTRTTSFIDKKLEIEIRNMWGNNVIPLEESPHDATIQNAINLFRTWASQSKCRESIIGFKCYLCNKGWWHLNPFRDHIRNHKNVQVVLEIAHREVYMVAQRDDLAIVRDVPMEGECWRCLKTGEQHKKLKKRSEFNYFCKACNEKFFTCTALIHHEGKCIRYHKLYLQNEIRFETDWQCEICYLSCLTKVRYDKHMVARHSVRSDMPTDATNPKICVDCNGKYHLFNHHWCPKKPLKHKCTYCCRLFKRRNFVNTHVLGTKSNYYCPVCNEHLKKHCMEMEHIAQHSKNYMLAYKCIPCKENLIFPNERSFREHWVVWHQGRLDKRRGCCEMWIVPRHCMTADKMITLDLSGPSETKDVQEEETREFAETVKKNQGAKIMDGLVRIADSEKSTKRKPIVDDMHETEKEILAIENEIQNTLQLIGEKRKKKRAVDHDSENESQDSMHGLKRVKTEEGVGTAESETENTVGASKALGCVKDEIESDNEIYQDENSEPYNSVKPLCENNSHGVKIQENEIKRAVNAIIGFEPREIVESDDDVQIIESDTEEIEIEDDLEIQEIDSEIQGLEDKIKRNIIHKFNKGNKTPGDVDITTERTEVKQEKEDYNEYEENEEQEETDFFEVKEENIDYDETVAKVFRASKHMVGVEVHDFSAIVNELNIKAGPIDNCNDAVMLDTKKNRLNVENPPSSSEESSSNYMQTLNPIMSIMEGFTKRKLYHCNKCNFEGPHKEYKEHISQSCPRKSHIRKKCNSEKIYKTEKWGPQYDCSKCDVTFTTGKAYALHFERHNLPKLACPQCKKSFERSSILIPHIMMHVKELFNKMQIINDKSDFVTSRTDGVYQCKVCSEVVMFIDFFKHWERHLDLFAVKKETVPSYSEDSPNEKAKLSPMELKLALGSLTNSSIDYHGRLNPPKNCELCLREFSRQSCKRIHLIEHLLRDAYANKQKYRCFVCQICQERFEKAFQYKAHMRKHAALPLYKCELCDKTFSDSSNFAKHKKIHNLSVMICDICKKKFQSRRGIEKHMMMHRTMEPMKCPICDRVFYSTSQFRKHQRAHIKKCSKYTCIICKTQFNSLKHKWDHMWEVHKERKFEADCPFCPESYRKFADLKRHVRDEHMMLIKRSGPESLCIYT